MDIRFKCPFTYIVAGSSQSGKSTHVRNVLKNMEVLFTKVPDYTIYFYSQWQPIFSEIQKDTFQLEPYHRLHVSKSNDLVTTFSNTPPHRQPKWLCEKKHHHRHKLKSCFKEEKSNEIISGQDSASLAEEPNYEIVQEPPRPLIDEWINKLPTIELLKEKSEPYINRNGILVIIDDFINHLEKDLLDLWTVLSHSNNISVILLTQNLFSRNKIFRTLSLNTQYISIFKNPRDQSQIRSFASQFQPYNIKWVVDAYKKCTEAPYTYMLFDNHQSTPEGVRVRSHIIPGEGPVRVYAAKTKL